MTVQALKSDKNLQFYDRKHGHYILAYFSSFWASQGLLKEIQLKLSFHPEAKKNENSEFSSEDIKISF